MSIDNEQGGSGHWPDGIDGDALDELRVGLADDGLLASLVRQFIVLLEPRVAAIDAALAVRDPVAARDAAQLLRSPSSMLGARELSVLCGTIAIYAQEDAANPADAAALRRRLVGATTRTRRALTAVLAIVEA